MGQGAGFGGPGCGGCSSWPPALGSERRRLSTFYSRALATLIIKDRNKAAKRGDVSTLDMDPFIDAQDWDISAFDIAVRDTGADKATATVSFKNMGKPTTVVLDLVKLREGWRIADINWGRKPTLRGLFAKR